jgi:GDP-L-fucose synthase
MRDFIYIDDCVKGAIATMDQISDGSAVNLSTGVYTSFIEFAQMAAKVVGYTPVVAGMSDMPSGVFARGGDTTLQTSLGFSYTVNFKDGIRRALQYYENLKA